MKILFAVHTYYPEQNGVQNVTEYLAEGLAEKGHDISVITNLVDDTSCYELYNGVAVYRIKIDGRKGHRFYGEKNKYYELIYKIKPDAFIVVCAQSWTLDWIATHLRKLNCIKILYTHGYSEYQKNYGILKKLVEGHLLTAIFLLTSKIYFQMLPHYIRQFDLVTYLTKYESAYEHAIKYRFTNGKILGNAVDDRMWDYCYLEHEKNFFPGKKIRILNVGNYEEIKNQMELLEIYYEIAFRNIELYFVGGRETDYYRKLVNRKQQLDEKYGYKDVLFNVGLNREKVIEQYMGADIYVATSIREAFSISLCEAAATGIPIVATNTGNVEEFDGILIAHSRKEFVDFITKLAGDFEYRRCCGNKLYKYAKEQLKRQEKVDWFDNELYRLAEKN